MNEIQLQLPNLGGHRDGAGRKPVYGETKKKVTLLLTPTVAEFIEAKAQADGRSRSDWLERHIRQLIEREAE